MSGKKPIILENYVPPEPDGTISVAVDFDFDTVSRNLGEAQPHETPEDKLAWFIRQVFVWKTDVNLDSPDSQQQVARRFLRLAGKYGLKFQWKERHAK